jgi:hypothetical protein
MSATVVLFADRLAVAKKIDGMITATEHIAGIALAPDDRAYIRRIAKLGENGEVLPTPGLVAAVREHLYRPPGRMTTLDVFLATAIEQGERKAKAS